MLDGASYFEEAENRPTFRLTEGFWVVYHRSLGKNLFRYPAIREQVIGPNRLGLKVVGLGQKPMIDHDDVREGLFRV